LFKTLGPISPIFTISPLCSLGTLSALCALVHFGNE
jgi:hypothetical protein